MSRMIRLFLFTLIPLFSILETAYATPADNVPQPQSRISQAAIAVPDKYAARVAEEILLAGGNAVDAAVATGFSLAVTYTINWGYGSGVVGNTANEIQPEKRMLSSMSPTIVLQNDKPLIVVGTPGGSTIFTSVFQAIVNILDFKMTPLQAASAGRFHHQLLPPDLITQSPSRPLKKMSSGS